MTDECFFCNVPEERVIDRWSNWFVMRDMHPVSEGHTLVILNEHKASITELTPRDWKQLQKILDHHMNELREELGCTDFNVGVNDGPSAGQTIPHVHFHIIPRKEGDCENPRGGVRKVKPPLVEY